MNSLKLSLFFWGFNTKIEISLIPDGNKIIFTDDSSNYTKAFFLQCMRILFACIRCTPLFTLNILGILHFHELCMNKMSMIFLQFTLKEGIILDSIVNYP